MLGRMSVFAGWAVLLVACGRIEALANDVGIEIRPASTQVRIGDPLLFKVLVTNDSRDVVKLPRKIATSLGTLRFEVRGPRDIDFRGVISTTFPGMMSPPRWNELLRPRATVVSCEALYAFAEPGNYSIRVRVGTERVILARSPAIEIEALARPENEAAALQHAASILELYAVDGTLGRKPEVYEQTAAQFGQSQIKMTLLWKAAVARVRDARERDEVDATRKVFDSLREKADPVTRDWMTLSVAGVYVRAKQYQSAIAELDEIKDANTQKAQLLREISEIQREAFEREQRRQKKPAD